MASACAVLTTSLDKPLASNGINHPDLLVIVAECGEKWKILIFLGVLLRKIVHALIIKLLCLEQLNMSSYDLSNVLLPAVLISSAVFSTLTLPFALIKNEPIAVELPYFSGEIPPIFNSEHKDVAIPYIGISIVASVGAGIASVEVNRRWQAYRSALKEEEKLPSIQQSSQGNSLQQEALDIPEYRPEVSAIDLSSKEEVFIINSLNLKSTVTETHDIDVESPAQVFDVSQQVEFKSTLPENNTSVIDLSKTLNFFLTAHNNNSLAFGYESNSNFCTDEIDLFLNNLIKTSDQYKKCRLKLPHLKRDFLAIIVAGEYYRFLRVENTREKVRETMAKLGDRLGKTVITITEKGYVIWVLEPDFFEKK
jgi:hypothetical protein